MRNEQPPNELRDRIRDWLLEDDYEIEERFEDGLSWFLVAKTEDARGFGVSQRVNKRDEVYIRVGLEFDKAAQQSLAAMSASARETLYNEVRFYLLSVGVEFQPEGKTIWTRLTISHRIFEDAPLTKDEFIRRTFNVQRGTIGVIWLLNEAIPDAFPDTTPTTSRTVH